MDGPKLLVIFGAGASVGSTAEKGRFAVANDDRFPDTEHIFDGRFKSTLFAHPNVEALVQSIEIGVSSGKSLEQVLTDLALSRSSEIRRQVAMVPLYLRELFGGLSAGHRTVLTEFIPLIQLIQDRGIDVCFATLNYDTLVERAIQRTYGSSRTYTDAMDGFGDYLRPESGWRLIKLHGSVDWVHEVAPVNSDYAERLNSGKQQDQGRYLDAISQIDPYIEMPEPRVTRFHNSFHRASFDDGSVYEGEVPVRPANPGKRRQEKVREVKLFYPAMAIPRTDKPGFICPDDHTQVLADFVAADPAVLVIGNQGLDRDLMDFLQNHRRDGSQRPFLVVDYKGENVGQPHSRFADALGRSIVDATNATSPSRYDEGFSAFVRDLVATNFMNRVANDD